MKDTDELEESTTITLYKGKGDSIVCSKHRKLGLLERDFKVYDKVLEGELRSIPTIGENQFGFILDRSTIVAIFIVRQLQEMFLKKNST